LYKRVKCWKSVSDTARLIQDSHKICHPNLKIVEKIIADNIDFQNSQIDPEQQEQARTKRQMELED